jgi:hypothetical protein
MKKDCPSQRTYIATDDGYISASDVEDDGVTSDDVGDDAAIDGDAAIANFWNIIVQRVLGAQPETSGQQQRHNLFQTFFVIKDRRARVIIDGGSCNNLVSSDLVKKLSLPTRPCPHPYHIQWFNDTGKVKVTQTVRVHFSLVYILIMRIVMLYLWKHALFCWVDLGNMIMMHVTMVGVIHTLSCIRARKLLFFL